MVLWLSLGLPVGDSPRRTQSSPLSWQLITSAAKEEISSHWSLGFRLLTGLLFLQRLLSHWDRWLRFFLPKRSKEGGDGALGRGETSGDGATRVRHHRSHLLAALRVGDGVGEVQLHVVHREVTRERVPGREQVRERLAQVGVAPEELVVLRLAPQIHEGGAEERSVWAAMGFQARPQQADEVESGQSFKQFIRSFTMLLIIFEMHILLDEN